MCQSFSQFQLLAKLATSSIRVKITKARDDIPSFHKIAIKSEVLGISSKSTGVNQSVKLL